MLLTTNAIARADLPTIGFCVTGFIPQNTACLVSGGEDSFGDFVDGRFYFPLRGGCHPDLLCKSSEKVVFVGRTRLPHDAQPAALPETACCETRKTQPIRLVLHNVSAQTCRIWEVMPVSEPGVGWVTPLPYCQPGILDVLPTYDAAQVRSLVEPHVRVLPAELVRHVLWFAHGDHGRRLQWWTLDPSSLSEQLQLERCRFAFLGGIRHWRKKSEQLGLSERYGRDAIIGLVFTGDGATLRLVKLAQTTNERTIVPFYNFRYL